MDVLEQVPELFSSQMAWSSNLSILECVFANLDLEDLKSVSLVCQTWCLGATKAFEQRVNPVIKDASQKNSLELALGRFRRHKLATLNFDNNPPDCPSFLVESVSAKKMPFLTMLSLHYEGTFETVSYINRFLAQLNNDVLPQLKQLELCPYGEHDWSAKEPVEVSSTSNSQHEVHSAVESSLQVLRVRVGHPSTVGLDWSFLQNLINLKELCILELDFVVGQFGAPLDRFTNSLKDCASATGIKIQVCALWAQNDYDHRIDRWPSGDVSALKALFDAAKPNEVCLLLQKPYSLFPKGILCRSFKFSSLVPKENLSRYSVEMQIFQTELKTLNKVRCSSISLAGSVAMICHDNLKVTGFVSLNIDFGSGKKTFLEFGSSSAGKENCIRYGPRYGENEQMILACLVEAVRRRLEGRSIFGEYKRLWTCSFRKQDGIAFNRKEYHLDPEAQIPFPQDLHKLPWKETKLSEPGGTLGTMLTLPTRTSAPSKEFDLPVSYCELYLME